MLSKNSRIEKANLTFWESLGAIQAELNLSDETLSSLVGLQSQTLRKLRSNNESLNIPQLYSLCDELELDPMRLFRGEIDLGILKAHHNGIDDLIPTKFLNCPNSKAFTVNNILSKIRDFSPETEKQILRSLQIKRLTFLNDDQQPISVELPSLILERSSHIFSKEHFYEWGRLNAFQLKNGLFGDILKQARNVQELFEVWLSVEELIENNWDYRIWATRPSHIIIRAYPSQQMLYHHKKSNYSNLHFAWFRAGFAAVLPRYINKTDATVSITRTVHENSSFCEFSIRYYDINQPLASHSEGFLH